MHWRFLLNLFKTLLISVMLIKLILAAFLDGVCRYHTSNTKFNTLLLFSNSTWVLLFFVSLFTWNESCSIPISWKSIWKGYIVEFLRLIIFDKFVKFVFTFEWSNKPYICSDNSNLGSASLLSSSLLCSLVFLCNFQYVEMKICIQSLHNSYLS